MFEIAFNKVTLAKANRYLVLLSTTEETKRTEVSSEWTSTPEFQPLQLGSIVTAFQLKVCEATSDRKLKIVGSAQVKEEMLSGSDPIFEGDVKIEQNVEGNLICVGICNIRISKRVEFEEVQMLIPQANNISQNQAGESIQNDEQLRDIDTDQEANQQIRCEFHCGMNFYLNSAFYIEVLWGSTTFKTKAIKDKLSPVWGDNTCLSGPSSKPIEIRVCDHKENILENLKIGIQALRIMYPYHLRLKFKEEWMGAIPEIFFTLVRESFPLFSIMQIPIRFSLKGLEESRQTFLILSFRKQSRLPKFIEIDRSKIISLAQVNQYMTGKGEGDEDRIDFLGLPVDKTIKNISIFKSYLNRKLYLHVFRIVDLKSCFVDANWSSCRAIETKGDFQAILRKVYYHGESYTLKKYFDLFNPSQQLQEPNEGQSRVEQWRVLSSNYVLRHKLVNASTTRIEELKKIIEKKGKQLIELKKILKEVTLVNSTLAYKQKLINVIKNKKIKYNIKQVGIAELTTALISKQAELQNQKRINSQLALRMDSLSQIEQNQGDLDHQLLRNAQQLLKQQQMVKKMNFMEKGVKRQRQIIGQLQKIFEQRQIDKNINEALKEQSQKLRIARQKKQEGLNKIYAMMKDHSKEGQSLYARIKRAEEILIGLNEQYAKLIAL